MIPIVIVGSALDDERYWSSPLEQLKLVFSREVLPKIEKGVRKVGLDDDGSFCANCYYYGVSYAGCMHHDDFVYINWEQFKKNGNSWIVKVFPTIEVTTYFQVKTDDFGKLIEHHHQVMEVIKWNTFSQVYLPPVFGIILAARS